eukprot:4145442-Pyramimonas_sp.AAC.1
MHAEGRTAVDNAKKQVLDELKRTARTFKGQLAEHLQQARAKAEGNRTIITQAHKKRKADQEVKKTEGDGHDRRIGIGGIRSTTE